MNKTKGIALGAMIAALYAVVTLFAPIPQYAAVQVRFADALALLPLFLGWPAAIGLSLGCLVANVFSPYGVLDMVIGTMSTVLGSVAAVYIGRMVTRKTLNAVLVTTATLQSVITALLIGWLLTMYGVPFEAGAASVLVGELVSIGIIGIPLHLALVKVQPTLFVVPNVAAVFEKEKTKE